MKIFIQHKILLPFEWENRKLLVLCKQYKATILRVEVGRQQFKTEWEMQATISSFHFFIAHNPIRR